MHLREPNAAICWRFPDAGEPNSRRLSTQDPAYAGGRLPLSTHLARRVREIFANPWAWRDMPESVQEWLRLQLWRSVLPDREGLLVETFPRGEHEYLVAYCLEGRNAHQTLGMLLTKRMERALLKPLGFVATDYVLAIWSLEAADAIDALISKSGCPIRRCCVARSATLR
jgi:ATP-dependent helicase Lhr and Lhr-like helicase